MVSSSIASESRFPAHPIETDVTAIARLALINLYIKYPLRLKNISIDITQYSLGKEKFNIKFIVFAGPWKLHLVGVDTDI
jgi:hypothetical protein